MKKKIITGVKPTGASMHLGNLMGAVLPFKEIAKNHDSALFIADLHALTSVKDGEMMRKQSLELAIEYFSIFGLDTETIIFRQSDIKNITKLMWILANVTPYSLMLRAHSFKDFENKEKHYKDTLNDKFSEIYDSNVSLDNVYDLYYSDNEKYRKLARDFVALKTKIEFQEFLDNYKNAPILNMGTFNYPILMAADILGYSVDAVPVGKDQIQHLEMARDMARAFNKTYQTDIFIEPEALISQQVATLPGIDGRKMSKSYDNFIGIFDDEKTLKKRVMSIVTDSRGVDEKKDPETCNVFALLKVFAKPEKLEEIREKYLSENI